MNSVIQRKLQQMKETNYLDLADAAINTFDELPAEFPDLHEFHLERNYFRTLEGFPFCPKLAVLNIAENALTDFTGLPSEFPILREINASHNQIHSFRHFPITCPKLKELDLSHNQFRTFEGFPSHLRTHLTSLNIEGNPIETFAGIDSAILFSLILQIKRETLDQFPLEARERELLKVAIEYPIGDSLRNLEDYLGST